MNTPFNILDFLDRAEHVYGDRVGVIDEPDQPADSWGRLTWRHVAETARAMAAGLDALGVGPGERVAIVSQNSARLLVALFAVSGYGRVIVPINFRLNAEEVQYIVEQSGASVLLVDPELDGPRARGCGCAAPVRAGPRVRRHTPAVRSSAEPVVPKPGPNRRQSQPICARRAHVRHAGRQHRPRGLDPDHPQGARRGHQPRRHR